MGMSSKHPIGVLGWSEADFAEHARSGAWPQREARSTADHLGFSLPGEAPPPVDMPKQSDDVSRALRELWRAAVMPEAMREAKTNLARSRAARGVETRRAKTLKWKAPAEIAAREILAGNAQARISDVERKIRARLKAKGLACPGQRTLERLVVSVRTREKKSDMS